MTKIKLCGLRRSADIEVANRLRPDYIGFVFAPQSKRYTSPEQAALLKAQLDPAISAVGVFVDEDPEQIAVLVEQGIIDLVQLHGGEDENDIQTLRRRVACPILKAFRVEGEEDLLAAKTSTADYVLLDSGSGGTGTAFDWGLIRNMDRPFFLAGGLEPDNVREAVARLNPFGVDVSSGIETGGWKDQEKMRAFVERVRGVEWKEERI